MKKISISLIILLAVSTFAFAQRTHPSKPTPSGGPLSTEQAAFDVQSYDITARVNPAEKSISGTTIIEAKITIPTKRIELDLDTPFEIKSVKAWHYDAFADVKFVRDGGKLFIEFPESKQPGDTIQVSISYAGKPRIAPNPPWVGGFMWEKTADGSDWITVACQNDGADLWFPVKDHPSDEASSATLHITVPENLYVASVGKLTKIDTNNDRTKTYNWYMSNSINNYNIVINIAPYVLVEDSYKSVAGETFPVIFYALPESAEKARDIVRLTKEYVAFYEKYAGPYPYRAEKLGIAETPHLGMEHSTIIAYGNKFRKDASGYDWLMLHELGHEWWGNLVTASDWRDMWLHEGFQSYFDSLFIEHIKGKEAYLASMRGKMAATKNFQPVAPRESKFTYEIYFQAPDYVKSDGDIYGKGASILHTLRYLIGDEAFFASLKKMAYPTDELRETTDGGQSRLVTTDDFRSIAEAESGKDLSWFFDVYLRQPKLPELKVERVSGTGGESVNFKWITPDNLPFPMPITIKRDGSEKRLEFKDNFGWMPIQRGEEFEIDPEGWVLRRVTS
ncbi:MAG: M1 family metallopeptidase [Pyrinomonadaceae bacterium]